MSTPGGTLWIPPVPALPGAGTQIQARPCRAFACPARIAGKKRAGSPPTTGPGVPAVHMAGPCSNSSLRPWALSLWVPEV